MRNPCLALIALSLFAGTGMAAPLSYAPDKSPPTLQCSLTQHCLVTLPAGERLMTVTLGDPDRWIASAETFGTDPERDFVALRPLYCDVRTRLTMATTSGLYTFPITGRCDGGDKYNPETEITDVDIQALPSRTGPGASLTTLRREPPTPAPPILDVAFIIENPNRLRGHRLPTVRADATRTYLTWPKKPRALPRITLERNGKPVTLRNPLYDADLATLAFDDVLLEGDVLRLRLGNKMATIRRPN